jgi:hypothetical protein
MNKKFAAAMTLLTILSPVLAQEPEHKPLMVIDLRPKEEREGFGLAALEGKCNKDVFRIPDVAADPMKVEILKSDLTEQMAFAADGKTLTVLNWSIYYNKQVSGGGKGMLESVGIQGYTVPTKGEKKRLPGSKCSKKESAGGWYEGKESTTSYFPIISEFEGTYGGKPLSVRVVHSPGRKIEGKFEGDPSDTDALIEAVHKTSEAVILAIVQ